jgi:enoyl-CoA hydratase
MSKAGAAPEEGELVKFETQGHVAVFTLDRPKAMNAVSGALSQRFEALLERFEADDNLWIGVVCSSHAKVFAAGADLKAISRGENLATKKGGFAGMVHFPRTKPLIAAVDGAALAGGCEIVLSCDMVVASKSARFGLPEVKRSLVPAAGGLFRLPRKIPQAVAMEMLLTGDPLPAERMYQLGLVNQLTETGQALAGALALAKRIEVNAPLAVREARKVAVSLELADDARAWKESAESIKRLSQTPDFFEGPKAFAEKREPKWTGKAKL